MSCLPFISYYLFNIYYYYMPYLPFISYYLLNVECSMSSLVRAVINNYDIVWQGVSSTTTVINKYDLILLTGP